MEQTRSKLPSVRVDLSPQELAAIAEFAKQCGESIPDLLRKIAIREATLSDGYGADDPSYNFKMALPFEGYSSSDHQILEFKYNLVRRIMGWREIRL
jgi:hypothetical protein